MFLTHPQHVSNTWNMFRTRIDLCSVDSVKHGGNPNQFIPLISNFSLLPIFVTTGNSLRNAYDVPAEKEQGDIPLL